MSYALIDINRIQAWLFDKKVQRKIKRANKLHKLTQSKFVVLILGGKPRIYKKKDIRLLVKKGIFKKNSLDDVLKEAIHITTT